MDYTSLEHFIKHVKNEVPYQKLQYGDMQQKHVKRKTFVAVVVALV